MIGGFATIYSIGLPFVVLGIALVAIRPLRRHSWFADAIAAVTVAILIAAVVAPAACRAKVGRGAGRPDVICTSVIGTRYADRGRGYAVSGAAAVFGAVAGAAVSRVIRRRLKPT